MNKTYENLINILLNIFTEIIYGFGLAYMFWFYQPNDKIDSKYVLVVVGPLIILVVILAKLFFTNLLNEKQSDLPKIISIDNMALVLEPNEYFAQDIYVCLYFADDDFEKCIGYGYVETIQTKNKNIQIKVEQVEENYKKYLNNKNRNKIFVKPCITRQIYNNLLPDNTEKGGQQNEN